ncbi:26S proteasome regulatory subunit [Blastocladiella emersonii ATCC 22665]|nr:26S proteasome regulatory subunit [Blastocladiella emersonii ATCC 22665]
MSSAMQIDLNPRGYLRSARAAAQAAGAADVVAALNVFEDLYDRKLWHQLSTEIDRFLTLPAAGTYLVDLYEQFVRDFESKLNKLSLVAGIGEAVARHLPDHPARIEFLTSLAERVAPAPPKKDEEHLHTVDVEAVSAHLLASTHAAYYQLLAAQYDAVAAHIAASEKVLDAMDGVDTRVSSAFYRVAADYYKAKSAFAKFYKTSLLYLGCVGDVAELPVAEATDRAYELGIAALLSDEIYNFGELLMHPILDKLDGTPRAWLKSLLFAFNAGDIAAFEKMASALTAEPLLVQNMTLLRQKICLMALIDFVFKRKPSDRVVPFAAVAQHTRLPIGEVEHLLMKALALNLIKGSMDQVDATVTVTWVAPRVLDRSQILVMADLLAGWTARVQDVAKELEANGAELFTSA